MEKELNEDQKAYLASFKEAMRAIDEKLEKDKTVEPTKAYKELKRDGLWSPDLIAFQFMLCTKGLSPLSHRLREYIINVGALAKQIFDKSQQLKNQNNESND